ncbi:hypothetical protein [Streptomyces sp. NBC_00316]|uniref:hypothetical protein n=1 Tax=Streptomyces sp. NBC_00316 TaxID=2975710 RepID=UPI002E2D17FC|nr:hypothetical protein [Streptomyces sp. NBC_00316]
MRGLLGIRGTGSAARGAVGGGRRACAQLLVPALVAVVGLVLGGTGANSAEAASVCSGRPAETVKFPTGELRVYKSRGYACAETVTTKPGKRRAMSVRLQARGGGPVVDSGRFTTLAGPVTVHALHRCVRASGSVAGASASTGWILCSR